MDEVPVAGSAAGAAEAEAAAAGAADARHWPLAERPGFLARRMHQIHVSLFAERCAAFRVTPLQYSLLSLLRDLEEADQTTLASAVALDRTTTTGALKRLAARGLVSRTTSPLDRRAWADLLDMSAQEASYIDESVRAGEGLLIAGGARVPLKDDFPKGKLYELFNTKPEEIAAKKRESDFAKRARRRKGADQ